MAKIYSFREYKNKKAEEALLNDRSLDLWLHDMNTTLGQQRIRDLRRQYEAYIIHLDATKVGDEL